MIEASARHLPNHAEVAAKVIDGDAVIMNFVNGLYYTMTGTGAAVWEGVEAGATVAETAAHLAGRFDVSEARASDDVGALLEALVEAGLVVPAPPGTEPGHLPDPSGDRAPYAAPELLRHDDMAELLTLDPPMPGLGDAGWGASDDQA